MAGPRIIVCEKTGKWATSLRMVLSDLQAKMTETRSLMDLLQSVEACPTALVAMELSALRFEAQLCCLLELARRYPRTQTIVLAERGMRHYELAVREAGAAHFLCSPRSLLAVGRLIRRHMSYGVQEQTSDLHQSLWNRLPWGPE